MADIAASDVTYTLIKKTVEDSSMRNTVMTVAFGNGSLTYPSGGIPLTKGKMGAPNQIVSAAVYGPASADGIIYKYDAANNKIRMYRSAGFTPAGTNQALTFTGTAPAAHTHDLFIATGASDDAGSRVNAITAELSIANAAITIAGIAAASGAAGGVVQVVDATPAGTINTPTFTGTAVTAGSLAEFSGAVTAATLYIEVKGW